MKAAGRRRVAFWVTDDEARIIRAFLRGEQELNVVEGQYGVPLVPSPAPYRVPGQLGDCAVVPVTVRLASTLVRRWHSVLPHIAPTNIRRNRHHACFALVYGDYAFGVAVYSSPVNRHLDDGRTLELRRLALSPVRPENSATWFMARCKRALRLLFPSIDRLISYQDAERHLGTIYRAGGWTIAAQVRYVAWSRSRADRKPSQTKAPKVRWVKQLR